MMYEGSHLIIFTKFLKLAEDRQNQIAVLKELVPWSNVEAILSIGGGDGYIELELLGCIPRGKLWYIDPSVEQCEVFKRSVTNRNLSDRVEEIQQLTFQQYEVHCKFDLVLSIFSWFYIGNEMNCYEKLMKVLKPQGIACILMPNIESIETDFNLVYSPDERTVLTGDKVERDMKDQNIDTRRYTYTKWLPIDQLLVDGQPTDACMAFASFIAMKSIGQFSSREKDGIVNMVLNRAKISRVPLRWDIIVGYNTLSG